MYYALVVKLLVFLYCGLAAGSLFAHSSSELDRDHYSGLELKDLARDVVDSENGTLIMVPEDYQEPNGRLTPLYFARPFGWDSSRPTVILFLGGPGETFHGYLERFRVLVAEGFNLVLFDNRGSGFSRPDNPVVYQKERYLSSLTTALDAESIRRFLGIQVWSVMGGSYGSIPATIYSSLFPNHTRATVLAGTVFLDQGGPHLYDLRQAKFENLLEDVSLPGRLIYRERIRQKIESQFAYNGSVQLDSFVKYIVKRRSDSIQRGRAPTVLDRLQMNDLLAEFRKRELGLKPTQPISLRNYPLSTPVTYIHGTHDPRTPIEGMQLHHDHVANGLRQIVKLEGWGHITLSLLPPQLISHLLHGGRIQDFEHFRCAQLLLRIAN